MGGGELENRQPVALQRLIMNANRWKSLSFSVSQKKVCLVVRLQVGEDEEEVGGPYVCIFTVDSYS